jgi:hypothetical protein
MKELRIVKLENKSKRQGTMIGFELRKTDARISPAEHTRINILGEATTPQLGGALLSGSGKSAAESSAKSHVDDGEQNTTKSEDANQTWLVLRILFLCRTVHRHAPTGPKALKFRQLVFCHQTCDAF